MRFGSLFTGIGGFDLGLQRAGHEIRWHVEIDKDCQAVLGRRFGADIGHGLFGDVAQVGRANLAAVDAICGGFPCQDLSVAGKRAGLAGARSGLFFEFIRIAGELAPRWVLIENVPGLLSSNDGRDMATVLATLGELGYGWAYRVLDAQYFGVAQRRRRVFIVGCLGNAAAATAVLFEPESGAGHPAPRRETRAIAAGHLARSLSNVGGGADYGANKGTLVAPDVAFPLSAERDGYNDGSDQTYLPEVAWALQERDAKGADSDTKDGHLIPVVYSITPEGGQGADLRATEIDVAPGLSPTSEGRTTDRGARVLANMAVRRLTPTECERLQGFPDGWTAGVSDSSRYRMLGNAVCVPVTEWIGRRMPL